ncbi:hypothetical protein W97_07974 [Coniosporium apollinis CBS 100218]|uniref:Uncharacterized protein n=1 Tax=Coniosporium apollinis (strain CBS 100218) TaxID=1168221 RepID=R7Z472_CONA1|nr:uncharacterized protein W97_07974 [Coniosporium apollinis CBS 100218]EON68716.1 hypothetical protein W97_07974 [Coniosporium apollinis CBS 100218]
MPDASPSNEPNDSGPDAAAQAQNPITSALAQRARADAELKKVMETVAQGKGTAEVASALKRLAKEVIGVIDKEARESDLRDCEAAIRERENAVRERETAARERETAAGERESTAADRQSTGTGSSHRVDRPVRPRGGSERFPDRRTERRRGRDLEERLWDIGETAAALAIQARRLWGNLRHVDGREWERRLEIMEHNAHLLLEETSHARDALRGW